ncbi:MAG: right-handed parallel beta-helix repeat-containing protein, partial [Candidatus Kryptoniota bacterium]
DTLLPGPGSTVRGFTIMSKALPGIRAFTAYSYFDVGKYTPDIDGDTTAALDSIYVAVGNYIDSMATNVNYSGWTIGPTAPPLNFDDGSWLDTLGSYTTQSLSLGWINNQGTANKYLNYFATAKKQLQSGDTSGCRQTLQTVVTNTVSDSTANITSEAYALLRFNTEYLIYYLPALPPQIPYVSQVNAIISAVSQAQTSNNIGDTAFVNSLDKQLTNAENNLSKGKVVQAVEQINGILTRIEKAYNNTLLKQPNGKPLPKSFVTQAGWTTLSQDIDQLLSNLQSIGTTVGVPSQFTTIQAAVNASQPGSTILVDSGTYNEVVNIASKDSLTLLASGNTTIQGVHIAKSSVVDVEGFDIDASSTDTNAVEIAGAEDSDITIESNEIQNSEKNGIKVGQYAVRTRIVNNVIVNNQENGIDFADGTSGAQYVINNTIVKNGWNGVEAASQQGIFLVNNIISFNGNAAGTSGGRYGIKRDAGTNPTDITLLNNLIIGNAGTVNKKNSQDMSNYQLILDASDGGNITTTGAEGIGIAGQSSAQFSDVLLPDYHLTDTSIAIDKGTSSFVAPDPLAGQLPDEDKDENARPQGLTYDLGAYELR